MKEYKIRKLGTQESLEIYEVRGSLVRKELDEEFTNYGYSNRFSFIPQNEIWLDENISNREKPFLIHQAVMEKRLMDSGKTYLQAINKSTKLEIQERPHENKPIKKTQIAKDGKISIYVVDGVEVRNQHDPNFTEGGHDLCYKYVPKNEVWIDSQVKPSERKYVLLHELTERKLMEKGMSYPEAHKIASATELEHRKHPQMPMPEPEKSL